MNLRALDVYIQKRHNCWTVKAKIRALEGVSQGRFSAGHFVLEYNLFALFGFTWALQFAVTATKIMICVLRCSSLVTKLNCIYFGHRVSKKPNKDHRLWIRKDSAGSGKKALCLVNTVRYNATRSWCFHLSMLKCVKSVRQSDLFGILFYFSFALMCKHLFCSNGIIGLKNWSVLKSVYGTISLRFQNYRMKEKLFMVHWIGGLLLSLNFQL